MKTVKELLIFESEKDLFSIKFRGAPVWMYLREGSCEDAVKVTPPGVKVSFISLWRSLFMTIKFTLLSKKSDVFIISNRRELVLFRDNVNPAAFTFMFDEKNQKNSNVLLFLVARLILRKLSYFFVFKEYRTIQSRLVSTGLNNRFISEGVRKTIGDYFFIRALDLLFSGRTIYHSAPVVPGNLRFIRNLNANYNEIQHGVIHCSHLGYVGIPKVFTKLHVYHKSYLKILNSMSYVGLVHVSNWLKEEEEMEKYKKVVFTQPIPEFQLLVRNMLKSDAQLLVQPHPRDDFDYGVLPSRIVSINSIFEVESPIFFSSSLIEKCLINDKSFYLVTLNLATFESHFETYRQYHNFDRLAVYL